MISKERLEELIKEGATIYSARIEVREIQLDRLIQIYTEHGEEVIVFGYGPNDWEELKDCYETKKQAEWTLKYHATRTEELNLPMWEEIKDIKNNKTIVSFYAKNKETDTVYMYIHAKHLIVETEYKEFLNTEFTEENYIKACDLCLKLFKGEE